MEEKKSIPLYLLAILKEYTDSSHALTTNELLEKLKSLYSVDIERRTLYRTIDTLNSAVPSLQITRNETGKGYSLKEREFREGEILLLCNAIHASNFISKKQSSELIHKLLHTQSRYFQKSYTNEVYFENPKKPLFTDIIDSLQIISHAIENNICIAFDYTKYDHTKRLVPYGNNPRTVEPLYIVYNDERPYLVASKPGTDIIRHYRIDRMTNVQLIKNRRCTYKNKKEAYEYASNKFFMFNGDILTATFLCREETIPQVIDFFGTDVRFIPVRGGYTFTIRGAKRGIEIFAQQYMDCIEILDPESLRQDMRNLLEDALQRYNRVGGSK